jgi:hypothetical protein
MARLAGSAFEATIDALLPEWPVLPPTRRVLVSAHCAGFVRRQLVLAPAHIRLGIYVLFALFRFSVPLRFGMRGLSALSREQRAAAMRSFALEHMPPLVALERVLRSMTTVAFLEHPDVMEALTEARLAATGPTASRATNA